ncbi:MAG: hypothetical protein GX847_10015 [Clostridiales bacterium]|nr:hypothetical protein [Clostridiales bacterium]
MNSLIDRYLYDVTKRLPENIRADVERELRSNIEDMLPENPGDSEIKSVLMKMGSPAKLAVSYHPSPRYLISPEYFDDYLSVLRIAAFTLAVLLAAISVFRIFFSGEVSDSTAGMVTAIVIEFISGAVTGVMHAFLWVTLAFGLFEHFNKDEKVTQWTPKKLPDVPSANAVAIKRSETVTGVIFSVLFTAAFLVGTLGEPRFIALYESGHPAVPVFSEMIIRNYLPVCVILIALMLFVAVVKFIKGRWTLLVAVSHSLYGMFSAVVGISLILKPDLLNDGFMTRFAEILNISRSALDGHIRIALKVVMIIIIIGTAADIIATIYKTVKSSRIATVDLSEKTV